jgi:hypothetical protein
VLDKSEEIAATLQEAMSKKTFDERESSLARLNDILDVLHYQPATHHTFE